jgi:hypothetical protein
MTYLRIVIIPSKVLQKIESERRKRNTRDTNPSS